MTFSKRKKEKKKLSFFIGTPWLIELYNYFHLFLKTEISYCKVGQIDTNRPSVFQLD